MASGFSATTVTVSADALFTCDEKPASHTFAAPSTVVAIATSSTPESSTFSQSNTPAPSTAFSAISVVCESIVAMVMMEEPDTASSSAPGILRTVVTFFTATFF